MSNKVFIDIFSSKELPKDGPWPKITYGQHASPFGTCFLATTARGICSLEFIQNELSGEHITAEQILAEHINSLKSKWPMAQLDLDNSVIASIVKAIFKPAQSLDKPFPLLLKGTNFQIEVWKALLKIPSGSAISYSEVANFIDRPKAVRAVASAIAANPIAYLIPCHRVIRKNGNIHQYRWGVKRKKALLKSEFAVNDVSEQLFVN